MHGQKNIKSLSCVWLYSIYNCNKECKSSNPEQSSF